MKVFHVSWNASKNGVSWNTLKEKFHSVSLPLEILQISHEKSLINRVTKETPTQMFSCKIYDIFKNPYFQFCKRLLLKRVLLPGLPFLITYTSGSNWYICFSFCIIIYSFVCQFPLHYYWYCYNQKQSSGGVLQKRCSYEFCKIHKKALMLESHI